MCLIVCDGVWVVCYCVVVVEVQVLLLVIIYYFKDIDDFIIDIFVFFVECNVEVLLVFWSSVEGDFQEMVVVLVDDFGVCGLLVEWIVELVVQYVQVQFIECCEYLLVEQVFCQEVLFNLCLCELVDVYQWIFFFGVVYFFQVFGFGQFEQDVKVLMLIILQMEYQGFVDGVE